jgi:hypothetical protein
MITYNQKYLYKYFLHRTDRINLTTFGFRTIELSTAGFEQEKVGNLLFPNPIKVYGTVHTVIGMNLFTLYAQLLCQSLWFF